MKAGMKALWVLALSAACSHASTSEEQGGGAVAASGGSEPSGDIVDRQLGRARGRDASKLIVTEGPNGRRIRLGGAFATAMRARVAANGALETECGDEHDAAEFHHGATAGEARGAEVRR